MTTSFRKTITLFVACVLLSLCASSAHAIILANTQDWVDVYSVLLHANQNGDRALFATSESIAALAKVVPPAAQLEIYESDSQPFIKNIGGQLSSAGYDIIDEQKTESYNLDLAPDGVPYILIARENFKLAIAIGSYAVQTGSWVFIVDDENVGDVVQKIQGSPSVLAIGNFKRDILEQIDPFITETTNNNNIYLDSQEIAKRFDTLDNVVLTDGSVLESEFFTTKNPILLSGPNKIMDDTYDFLQQNNVKSVVLVGNKLSVVGETIRSRSNKEISIFVKFGQSDSSNSGKVYALNMFQMPQPTLGLTVTRAAYNPKSKQLAVYFNNIGSAGLYELTTLSINTNGEEIATASDEEVQFLGPQEVLPVVYDVTIPLDKISDDTQVEFYTSYGTEPSQLDSFLTMENRFGPPFSTKLEIEEISTEGLSLQLDDIAYYPALKRIGIELTNDGQKDTYLSAKIMRLIVSGLEEDLQKEGSIKAGETKKMYLSVELDEIDQQENEKFNVVITYGSSPTAMVKTLSLTPEFKVETSFGAGITAMVVGLTGEGSPVGAAILLVVIVAGVVFYLRKRKKKS